MRLRAGCDCLTTSDRWRDSVYMIQIAVAIVPAILVVAVDQVTKIAAVQFLADTPQQSASLVRFEIVHNTHAGLGRFAVPLGARAVAAGVAAVAALSPDGERIAVAASGRLWFVQLAARKVVPAAPHVVLALGWSPDQSNLWAIGERSRVSSLPVR